MRGGLAQHDERFYGPACEGARHPPSPASYETGNAGAPHGASILALGMEHPAHAEFVVECALEAEELLREGIGDLRAIGEKVEEAFQLGE